MMLVKTYVAPSGIEGVGVFAGETIPKGETIWRFDPRFDRTLTNEELEALPDGVRSFLEKYSYPHHAEPGVIVLELDNGRFMNHSTEPNTDFSQMDFGYALRDIKAGDELTCDYVEFDPTFALLPSDVARFQARRAGLAE
jgi:SET domain-containing protein